MQFTVLTLFPDILRAYFENSIMAKAVEKGIISCVLVDIRDFARDKHRSCDDGPYGGGAGQLMLAEPLGEALDSVEAYKKRVIYVTPGGKPFTQAKALELSRESEIVIICGRYEGYDERIMALVDQELSVGDYVLTGGELPAMTIIDSIVRLIPGVLGGENSAAIESFSDGETLEFPQYTRPEEWRGMKVPEVLLSGHHDNIATWRAVHSRKAD